MPDDFREGDAVRVTGGRLKGFIGRYIDATGDREARVSIVLFGAAEDFSVALDELAATTEAPPRPRVTRTLPADTAD